MASCELLCVFASICFDCKTSVRRWLKPQNVYLEIQKRVAMVSLFCTYIYIYVRKYKRVNNESSTRLMLVSDEKVF